MTRRPWEFLFGSPAAEATPRPALPPIDAAAPARVETATFALG